MVDYPHLLLPLTHHPRGNLRLKNGAVDFWTCLTTRINSPAEAQIAHMVNSQGDSCRPDIVLMEPTFRAFSLASYTSKD